MRLLAVSLLCLFFASTLGCNSNSVEGAFGEASKDNIQKSCGMYVVYSTLHNYQGPESREEMLNFLSSDEGAKTRLERMGMDVSQLESYTMGRDGEPLEFRWGVESNPRSPAYVVCWEQVGVDGTVQVGVTGGTIVETDDEDELADLKAGIYENSDGNYGTYGDNE